MDEIRVEGNPGKGMSNKKRMKIIRKTIERFLE